MRVSFLVHNGEIYLETPDGYVAFHRNRAVEFNEGNPTYREVFGNGKGTYLFSEEKSAAMLEAIKQFILEEVERES